MTEQEQKEQNTLRTLISEIPASQKLPAQSHLMEENERLKTELAEVKRFLQELNYGGELKGVWKIRIERFVK